MATPVGQSKLSGCTILVRKTTSRAPSPQEGEKQIKDLVEVVFYLQEEILKLSPENRDRDRDAAPDPAKPRTGPGRKKAPG